MSAATILSLISACFTVARWLIGYAQEQQWMQQGAADAALKGIKDADAAIQNANAAKAAVRNTIAHDPSSLRDDDGFKRSE